MFMPDVRQFEAARSIEPTRRRPAVSMPTGIPGATLVETAQGWRAAEALRPGDRLATWDGGWRPVLSVRAERLQPSGAEALIRVPGGALDTCRTVWLRAGQHVLIRAPQAAAVLDAEAVLMPAAALTGHRGIAAVPLVAALNVVTLHFAEDEMIFAASGLCLHCAAEDGPALRGRDHCGYIPVLDLARSRDLMALIAAGAMSTADLARAA